MANADYEILIKFSFKYQEMRQRNYLLKNSTTWKKKLSTQNSQNISILKNKDFFTD